MPRQSITLTEQNDAWLKNHIEETGEFGSKSEIVNDLIRRARRAEAINKKLVAAENSGFVKQSSKEILDEFKAELKR